MDFERSLDARFWHYCPRQSFLPTADFDSENKKLLIVFVLLIRVKRQQMSLSD